MSLTLAEIARRTEIPESTLRYRARTFKAVLNPTRSRRWKGVRYPETDIERFVRIHALLEEGLDAPAVEDRLREEGEAPASEPETAAPEGPRETEVIELKPNGDGGFASPDSQLPAPAVLIGQLGNSMRDAVRSGVQEATQAMVTAVEQFGSSLSDVTAALSETRAQLAAESERARAAEQRNAALAEEIANLRARAEVAEERARAAEATLEHERETAGARQAELSGNLTRLRGTAAQNRQDAYRARREVDDVRKKLEDSIQASLAEAAELRGALKPTRAQLEEAQQRVRALEEQLAAARRQAGAAGLLRSLRDAVRR